MAWQLTNNSSQLMSQMSTPIYSTLPMNSSENPSTYSTMVTSLLANPMNSSENPSTYSTMVTSLLANPMNSSENPSTYSTITMVTSLLANPMNSSENPSPYSTMVTSVLANQSTSMNTSTEDISLRIMRMSSTSKAFIIAANVLIFLMGTFGNVLVIYVFGMKTKLKRSVDIQIVSLAVADLLAALFLPIVSIHDIIFEFKKWLLLGTFGCKILVGLDHITMLVSAFTLVFISIERLRVIGSVKAIRKSRKNSFFLNFFVWLLAIGITAPYMHAQEVKHGMCLTWRWTKIPVFIYFTVYVSLSCFIPVIILIIVYTTSIQLLAKKEVPGEDQGLQNRRKMQYRRITMMFAVIVVLFFLVTMPYIIFQFIVSYYGTFDPPKYFAKIKLFYSLQYGLYTLCHFNCCVNPFVYAKMHTNLKSSFAKHFAAFWKWTATTDTRISAAQSRVKCATISKDEKAFSRV